MKLHTIMIALAPFILICAAPVHGAAGAGDFAIEWHTIDCGGGTSSGGAWTLDGTIGQPDAGAMSGGDGPWTIAGGFWTGGTMPPPVPGDVNGDGVVNVDDLVALILVWGACPAMGSCPADLDGNGSVDVDDLVAVIINWS